MTMLPTDVHSPDDDDLVQLFERIQPRPSERFYAQMVAAPWRTDASVQQGTRNTFNLLKVPPLLLGISVCSVLVVALLYFAQPLRVQASELLAHLFAQTPRDVMVSPVSLAPTPTLDVTAFTHYQAIQPIDEVTKLVGFAVRVPTHTPIGCVLQGARYDPYLPHEATLTYQCDAPDEALVIVQHTKDTHYTEGIPVGSSAQVQTIPIGTVQGEYVIGRWDGIGSDEMRWTTDPHSLLLRWRMDNIEYAINATGYPLDDVVLIAESMK